MPRDFYAEENNKELVLQRDRAGKVSREITDSREKGGNEEKKKVRKVGENRVKRETCT